MFESVLDGVPRERTRDPLGHTNTPGFKARGWIFWSESPARQEERRLAGLRRVHRSDKAVSATGIARSVALTTCNPVGGTLSEARFGTRPHVSSWPTNSGRTILHVMCRSVDSSVTNAPRNRAPALK